MFTWYGSKLFVPFPSPPPDGSLYDMLLDEDKNPAPLPVDQSLYYLHQILQGVRFLHMSGVLHLDIKGDVMVCDDWSDSPCIVLVANHM